ncbi:sugar phosphate isomerase/epimerase [Bacteroidales bacterium]
MQTRRDFLRLSPLIPGTLLFSLLPGQQAYGSQSFKNDVGIQLWTFRNELNSDLEGTLDAIASLGYKTLEPYGFDGRFFGRDASDFYRICADRGLTIYSTHTGITSENAPEYTEIAAKIGLEFLVLPSFMGRPDKTTDDFKKVADELNVIGEQCLRAGVRFAYHNHDFEFKNADGKLLYEILLEKTDPALVSFQMDLYWVVKGGQDPFRLFHKFPGRFTTWHIKDISAEGRTAIVGNGKIDFKNIMTKAAQAGLEKLIVEQEQYDEGSPAFCAGQSLKYIQKHLL